MADFVHLHNHTDYSLLDGAQSVQTLIDTMGDLKMDSVGVTEHGNLFSMLPFYKAAQKAGIKPIIGCEVYVARGSHTERSATRETGWGYNHLILLAQNNTGLRNLTKLVSIGYLDGFYYRPRIDKDLLRQYSEGLICTSGCLKGEVQENAVARGYASAQEAALELAEIFPGRFYLELQRHHIPEEDAAREVNLKLARELALPLVATNDCHYALQEHWEAHDIMFCLGTGKDRDDPNRQRYATPEFYFKSVDEMHALFPDVPGALENSVAIAEQCAVELDLGHLHLPQFPIPESAGTTDPDEYLHVLSQAGLEERGLNEPVARERLNRELQVIRDMDYAGYFLIVADFIRYAKQQKIPVGPGRGSAAGSLVAYALNITNVDPLHYNLLFERFLNPDRVSMPDIDIDFCQERRGEVIDYVKRQYGEEAVCQIITFGRMKAKSVVRDVGRVLGLTYAEADRIAKMIPDDPKATIDAAMAENPDLVQAEQSDDRHRQLFAFSRVLEGMNRHASTHAAGVVIAPGDLTDYLPLYKHPKTGDITTQVDMNGLEDLGLLKMDFLGLRTLTVIDKTVKMLAEKGLEIDIDKIPLDDPQTYEIFAQGHTIGVFQFESAGMREFLTKLRPSAIGDLIAMNALYRPGPMAFIDDFIDRKHKRKKIVYLHQALQPILAETYGIIVYQEQVMQIAHDVAGFSLAQADIMRRAMGKKKKEEMAKMQADFLAGARSNGVDAGVADQIYDLIARFAAYGFNKSHSTAYAIVAYHTAWLKAHHPAEFMAANLSSEMSSPDRVPILMAETRNMNLEVLPPDVNRSARNFRVDDQGRIIFGLNAIKHVGQKAADHIRAASRADEPWQTLPRFLADIDHGIVNRKALDCLIRSGACDSLAGTRPQQVMMLDDALRYGQGVQAGANSQQEDLFGSATGGLITEPELPQVPDWPSEQRYRQEKELTGYYLTGHPLTAHENDLQEFANYDFTDSSRGLKLKDLRMGGIITQLKKHHTRQGRPMAFFTLEGLLGQMEVVVFADLYEKIHTLLEDEGKVFITGKPTARTSQPGSAQNGSGQNGSGQSGSRQSGGPRSSGGDVKLLAEDIFPLEQVRQRLGRVVYVRLDHGLLNRDLVQQLNELTGRNLGLSELRFQVVEPGSNGSGQLLRRIRATKIKITPSPELLANLRKLVGEQNVWLTA